MEWKDFEGTTGPCSRLYFYVGSKTFEGLLRVETKRNLSFFTFKSLGINRKFNSIDINSVKDECMNAIIQKGTERLSEIQSMIDVSEMFLKLK